MDRAAAERKARALVGRMTLEEKAAQMILGKEAEPDDAE